MPKTDSLVNQRNFGLRSTLSRHGEGHLDQIPKIVQPKRGAFKTVENNSLAANDEKLIDYLGIARTKYKSVNKLRESLDSQTNCSNKLTVARPELILETKSKASIFSEETLIKMQSRKELLPSQTKMLKGLIRSSKELSEYFKENPVVKVKNLTRGNNTAR